MNFKYLITFFIFIGFCFSYIKADSLDPIKKARIYDLEAVKHVLEVAYAAREWKTQHDGWDIEEEYQKAALEITEKSLTLKQYQQVIRQFINSTKDYHAGISFFSTESASLPFRVKTVDGRTFIDWVDENKLSPDIYAFRPGDEVIEFDGIPIQTVMSDLLQSNTKNSNLLTDIGLTDIYLTKRSGARGDEVPKGTLLISFRSQVDGKIRTNQLIWEYYPEYIKSPHLMQSTLFSQDYILEENPSNPHPLFSFCNPLLELAAAGDEEEGGLGSRISFVPKLGAAIWTFDGKFEDDKKDGQEEAESDDDYPLWNAYIYENEQGRKIGYLRIPHYRGTKDALKIFGKVIAYLEQNTEALVLDQVNNSGGSVNFTYDLASMLTLDLLKTPKHRIVINQSDVYRSLQSIDRIKVVLNSFDASSRLKLKKQGFSGDFFDYQNLLFEKHFCEFILDEWDAGRTLTNPTFIDGVDIINPHPKTSYSKPILFLINELDFSGGDFMPVILKDNQRITLFGTRTAGAGGYIRQASFPNQHGIKLIAFTGSIAERENHDKIESLGINPDIEYRITAEDIQNRYIDYVKEVNQAVINMLPPLVVVTTQIEEPGLTDGTTAP